MKVTSLLASLISLILFFVLSCTHSQQAEAKSAPEAKKSYLAGYVLDSACLFRMGLTKPISRQCALECAGGGSPLVILGDDNYVYLPIDNKMPASGQNSRLIDYAGLKVKLSGYVYERGGMKAIVISEVSKAGK
jgi:hypothetical protein